MTLELIDLYRQYTEALETLPFTGRYMPYKWSPLPNRLSAQWMAYSQMLDEFSRGLANTINDLTNYERQLRAWHTVIAPLSDDERLSATHEFIDPVATIAVNLPYVIQSRFAFAVAHLCHQANQIKVPDWADNLPDDKAINLGVAGCMAKPWRRKRRLLATLQTINDREYTKGTNNFRNVYTHRLEPRFVFGMSQIVTRIIRDDQVCYAFGGQEPLQLTEVAELLRVQRDRCYKAFTAFQELVREHAQYISDAANV